MKTDTQLQQDVIAELKWQPSINSARVGVEVKDGIVTLSGEVDSFTQKWHAERAAQRVSGVTAMATALKVHISGFSKRTDADIASSAEDVLSWNSAIPDDAVQVMVENGWVTLTGNLEWQYQRQAATSCVSPLMGVVGVNNQIGLKPPIAVSVVHADIEAALKRIAVADARKISVAVKGSDVTLSGHVHTWAERETATTAAWGTPGVRRVVDHMVLI